MDDHLKLLLLLSLSAFLSHASAEIPRRELESASIALRARGYNLFGNAVTLSDLLFQVLAGDQFTFFAPPDFSLFSLDMSSDAFRYVHSLRLHVVPRRLTLPDLRNLSLSPMSSVDTLVPRHPLFFATRRSDVVNGGFFDYFVVNGVRLSSPDIYLGRHIAVHGLDATLSDDSPPSDNFQDELGLHLDSPPPRSPSENSAPVPTPDLLSPALPPEIEVSSPDFQGSPMSPHPDSSRTSLPPSPEFAHSPVSPNLSPSAITSMPPESPHLSPSATISEQPESPHLSPSPMIGVPPESPHLSPSATISTPPESPHLAPPEASKAVSPSPANTISQKSPHLAPPEASKAVSPSPANTISQKSPHLAPPEASKAVSPSPANIISQKSPHLAPEAFNPVKSPPTNIISPESPHLAPEVLTPVISPPEIPVSPPEIPEVPSPSNDEGDHAGSGKSESEIQSDLSPTAESPASVISPPLLSPLGPPRIRSMPPMSQSEATESDDQNHPSKESKEAHRHTKHRKSKKKHLCGKHHRKHKCKKNHRHREGKRSHHHSPNWWSLEL